jgi:hypothetical protein
MSTPVCPKCQSTAVLTRTKKQVYECEDCEHQWPIAAAAVAAPAAAAPPKRLKLFLSYGRDQYADEVRALKTALEARGHEVWFDADHLKSGDWEHRIENGLAWCDRVVLTMTPHSVRRPDGYCLNELGSLATASGLGI